MMWSLLLTKQGVAFIEQYINYLHTLTYNWLNLHYTVWHENLVVIKLYNFPIYSLDKRFNFTEAQCIQLKHLSVGEESEIPLIDSLTEMDSYIAIVFVETI